MSHQSANEFLSLDCCFFVIPKWRETLEVTFLKTIFGESGMKTSQCMVICELLGYQPQIGLQNKEVMGLDKLALRQSWA